MTDRSRSLARIGLAALVLLLLPVVLAPDAVAAVCLDDGGVTVVVDAGPGEPTASCVPSGADRPVTDVLVDAEERPARGSAWSLWTSDGDGTWTRRTEPPAQVSVPDGGFVAWRRGPGEPRVDPRPLTEAERQIASRPPGTGGSTGDGDALSDVLVVVGVAGGVVALLIAGVWLLQRREDTAG